MSIQFTNKPDMSGILSFASRYQKESKIRLSCRSPSPVFLSPVEVSSPFQLSSSRSFSPSPVAFLPVEVSPSSSPSPSPIVFRPAGTSSNRAVIRPVPVRPERKSALTPVKESLSNQKEPDSPEMPIDPSRLKSAFLRLLEESNQKKEKDAPVALVLQAKYDPTGSQSLPGMRFNILQLAKTFQIAVAVLENNEVRKAIQKVREVIKRPIQLIVIDAHGSPEALHFGEGEERDAWYMIDDIKSGDFDMGSTEGTVLFLSCESDELAQRISALHKGKIFWAPREICAPSRTYTHFCLEHRQIEMVSLNQDNRQHARAFVSGESVAGVPCFNEEVAREKISYLKQEEAGDRHASFYLGKIFAYGIGVEPSRQQAFLHFKRAAEKNLEEAQHEVSFYYYREYLEGKKKSLQKSIRWCRLAAEQGHARSQYIYGAFYEDGEGVPHSLAKAKEWYQRAADQGYEKAVRALKRLSRSENKNL